MFAQGKDQRVSVRRVSSEDLSRDASAAMRAAEGGPVIVTEHGRAAFALLTIDDYWRLIGQGRTTLLDVMDAIPGGDVEFEPSRLRNQTRPINSRD